MSDSDEIKKPRIAPALYCYSAHKRENENAREQRCSRAFRRSAGCGQAASDWLTPFGVGSPQLLDLEPVFEGQLSARPECDVFGLVELGIAILVFIEGGPHAGVGRGLRL